MTPNLKKGSPDYRARKDYGKPVYSRPPATRTTPDSARYLGRKKPPPRGFAVLKLDNPDILATVARCARHWDDETLNRFGFAPGCLAALKEKI